MKNYVQVKILPYDVKIDCKIESKLIDIINNSDIEIDSICGGKGSCGKCKVKLISGELSNLSEKETKFLNTEEIDNNVVLACERKVYSDVTIEIISNNSEIMNKGKIIRTHINSDINKGYYYENKNPIVIKKYIKLPLPTLKDQRSDVKRIIEELSLQICDKEIDNDKESINNKKIINKDIIKFDMNLIRNLGQILQESNYEITASIFDNEVIFIEGGNTEDKNYAITIDLGTTTVAAYLINLNTGHIIDSQAHLNRQKKYGSDVISRINYSIKNEDNREKLRTEATKTIDITIEKLMKKNNIDKNNISIISILGNTAMSHLLIGASVNGISKSPFNSVFYDKIIGCVDTLGITSLNKNIKFILLPNIGGYVGSDTLSAIIGSDMINREGNILLLDIGTNCELALNTEDRIFVCSTAAGPAFEGANMKYGMRASKGAIYDCHIDQDMELDIIGYDKKEDKVENYNEDNSNEPDKYINNEAEGICGSGYISIVAKLLERNLIKQQGRIIKPENLSENISKDIKNRIIKNDKAYEVFLGGKVSITQNDISNLQLSKAAVKAGIELLMKEANINKLDKIILGGAFGSNLDLHSLKKIKMIPNIPDDSIEILGNIAGIGGIEILLDKNKYERMEGILEKIDHVELANHKDFNNVFTKSLMF